MSDKQLFGKPLFYICIGQIVATIFFYLLDRNAQEVLYFAVSTVILGVSYILFRAGLEHVAKALILSALYVTITIYIVVDAQTINAVYTISYLVLILFTNMFFNVRAMLMMATVVFISVVGIFLGESFGILHPHMPATLFDLYTVGSLIVIISGAYFISIQTNTAQAQLARKMAQDDYERLFQKMPIGIFRSTPDGRMLRANPTMSHLSGFENEEQFIASIGHSMAQGGYVDPQRRQEFRRMLEEDGVVIGFESEMYRLSDGEKHWVNETAYVVRGDSGEILFYEGFVQDVTMRKQFEADLKRQVSEFKLLANNVPAVIAQFDREQRYVFTNQFYERVTGIDPKDVLGLTIKQNMTPERYDGLKPLLDRVMSGETFANLRQFPNPEGLFLGEFSYYIPVILDGEVEGFYVLIFDETEKHEAEDKLADAQAQHKLIMDSATDAIITFDANGAIRSMNPAVEQIFGYQADELVGKSFRLILPPAEVGEEREESTMTPQVFGRPVRRRGMRRDQRELLVSVAYSRWYDRHNQPMYAAIVRDVTERTRREALFNQMQRLDGLGVLAGGIAHDFNNLLVGMMAQASLVRLKLPADSDVHEHLAKAERAASRAAELCNQLLAYSGKGHFEVRILDVNQFVSENEYLFRTALPSRTQIVSNLMQQLPGVEADQVQLQQVVMNVLLNAGDAIGDEGGTITIKTNVVEVSNIDIEGWTNLVTPPESGNYVAIEIQDTGDGMDNETLKQIFDPFFTTKSNGHGLGLAAVLGIVRGHKGALDVASELGRGTTFRILLPVAGDAIPAPDDFLTQENPQPALSHQILIVDDEDTVREAVGDVLQSCGYHILDAPDGESGLEMFSNANGKIDLIVLDLTMPGMSGEDVYRRIRDMNTQVPIIISSGYSQSDSIYRMTSDYATSFLQKPFRADSLLRVVEEMLATIPKRE